MDKMEKITWRIWQSPEMGRSLLIGGLLFYIPIVNLLLLGYFGCWLRQLVENKGMKLPEWRDGRSILDELAKVFLPFLGWMVLPWVLAILLVWALAGLLEFLNLGFFVYTVALVFTPLCLVAIVSPVALVTAMMRFYKSGNLRDAFAIYEIIREVIPRLKPSLFPLLQFAGTLILGYPLIGFAVFSATLPFCAQLVLVFREADADLKNRAF